jgi:ankyrin repeat protein
LLAAAKEGHTEIVHILLGKGADVNAAGGEYGSSLQAAAQGGHTAIVRILSDNSADVNAAGGEYGSSLLAAAKEGHTEIVRILLDKGADVNAGKYGSSLLAAAQGGHTEIVHILAEKGVDINSTMIPMHQTYSMSGPSMTANPSLQQNFNPVQANNPAFSSQLTSQDPWFYLGTDLNSPELFKQNLLLVQQDVLQLQEVAKRALNGMWVLHVFHVP